MKIFLLTNFQLSKIFLSTSVYKQKFLSTLLLSENKMNYEKKEYLK